jgi:cardiolipin synthase
LFGGPVARLSPWTRAVRNELTTARSIDMIAAYFAPNWAMLRRIGGIDKRGHARLITAAKSDNGATIGAARYTYWRLLRRGVQIFEYQPTKLHTKLIIFDNVVMIGSANFDMRSLYLNLEVMVRIEDMGFARLMRRYFDRETEQGERINLAAHARRRSLFARLRWSLCYFIVATMEYNVSRRLNFGIARD